MAEVTQCATCGDSRLKTILDLGDQPLAERDDGRRYPLILLECAQCGLVQLSCAVDRGQVFPEDHPYATGNTAALREHFGGLAQIAGKLLGDGDLIVDIGANDGTFLAAVRRLHPTVRVLAIEPTGQARSCRAKVIPVEQQFFTARLARRVVQALGPATVITASNVLAHAGDQHDFMTGVAELLAPGGTFITENHDWASVVNGLQIDTVYHEHLRYYSIASLGYLLAMHGFLTGTVTGIPTHGGSFRVTAVRQDPRSLQVRAETVRAGLTRLLQTAAESGTVYGISAATRATGLIHWSGMTAQLAAVCEVTGSAKIGTMIPGTMIPVIDEKHLITDQPPHAVLLAWHIADSVVPKLRAAGYAGQFIVPLPQPGIYRG